MLWDLDSFEKIYYHPLNDHLIFSDPDLTITVDLDREEQEKNGRRKFGNIYIFGVRREI